ncbi:DNA methyltransferase [Treponema sp. R6D11]
MPDTNGLKAILNHNETVQPNDDLLNTLKAAIPQFFDKDGNFKTDIFEDELKRNNIAEARDGYKLSFVGKDYARLQVGIKSETMIVPDCKHNSQAQNVNSGNVFITGDNIDALRHLVNAYENQIKLIYIDPPYNTGKEFVYSDNFEFSDEKLKLILGYTDEEITRLKSIQGKSSHSAWLTFMYPRLKIAHRLLKNDGVIFVSIDDNEQANFKLILDDLFGESNFVSNSILLNNRGGRDYGGIAKQHEYILIYTKSENFELNLIEEIDKKF